MPRAHQPDQSTFKVILPEDVECECVTQVTAVGPLGLEYHDRHDDPREKAGR